MTQTSTDLIVERLSRELRPVPRMRPPVLSAALWLAVSAAIIGALAWRHGLRPDLGQLFAEPGYRLSFIACLGTAGLGAAAAFLVGLPDRAALWGLLPVPALLLWVAGAGLGCYADWVRAGPEGLGLGTSFSCLGWIIAASLPLDALLVYMIRHAAHVRPRLALSIGMMSAAALASAGLMLFHEIETTLMVLLWHGGAVAIMVALGGLGAPLFRRVAGAAGR